MNIYYGKRKITLEVRKLSFFGRFRGLMFRINSEITENLLFEFGRKNRIAIHSFFVFFCFLAVWIDEKNNVVDFKIVKPFKPYISSKKNFFKLVEIPINEKNKRIIEFFVGKGKI